MTKTDGKYKYEDFLLRKRILKHEINEFEKLVSFEDLPKTLGIIGGNVKNKALDLIQHPNALSLVMDASMGLGAERLISRFVNKKSVGGKIILVASTYLIPMAINKAKNWLGKTIAKKNNPSLSSEEANHNLE